MFETATILLPDIDLEHLYDKEIPCSGTGHHDGHNKHLHGDPSQPAEWMIKHTCPSGCGHGAIRPVCDYFKENSMGDDRSVTCTRCGHINAASMFFTVLRRL